MLNLKLFLDMIKQNGIVRIEARFNGGGDSGGIDEVNIYDKNNQLIDPKNRGRVEIKKNKSIFEELEMYLGYIKVADVQKIMAEFKSLSVA